MLILMELAKSCDRRAARHLLTCHYWKFFADEFIVKNVKLEELFKLKAEQEESYVELAQVFKQQLQMTFQNLRS